MGQTNQNANQHDALSTPEQGAVNNPKYHAWAFVIYYYDQRAKA